MTRETVKSFKDRIFWFALPLIIALQTWIVVSNYDTQASIKVIFAQDTERDKMTEKIWVKLQENNTILNSKADQIQNEADHVLLMAKMDDIEDALAKITTYKKTAYDTVYIDSTIGTKPIIFLTTKN